MDLRAQREQLLVDVASGLDGLGLDATVAPLLDGPERAAALSGERGGALDGAEVVLVVVSMAAPPDHVLPALEPGMPVVVWSLELGIGAGGGMSGIVQDGATVGTPLLTSTLLREDRAFSLVSGALDDATLARCAGAVRAEALAAGFGRVRLGRLGEPIPGYASVDADDDALRAALGLEVVRLPATVLRDRAVAASAPSIVAIRAEVAAGFDVAAAPGATAPGVTSVPEVDAAADVAAAPDVPAAPDDDAWERSARLVVGLRGLVAEERLDAGTVNCHVDCLRHGPEVGVTPCFALGDSTSRGVPWTCTGDVLTAVALLVAGRLGGAAHYHEIEYLDPAGNAVLANSGEHDLRWLGDGIRPELRSNPWFRADPRTGAMAWFPLRPGPATMVAFVAALREPSGFRFVTAEGAVLDDPVEDSPTVGGRFRFAGDRPRVAWEGWVRAGVTHHGALAPGHLGEAVATVAARLEVGMLEVCRSDGRSDR